MQTQSQIQIKRRYAQRKSAKRDSIRIAARSVDGRRCEEPAPTWTGGPEVVGVGSRNVEVEVLLKAVVDCGELDGVEVISVDEVVEELPEDVTEEVLEEVIADVSLVVLASTVEGNCVTSVVEMVPFLERVLGKGTTVLVRVDVVSSPITPCAGVA